LFGEVGPTAAPLPPTAALCLGLFGALLGRCRRLGAPLRVHDIIHPPPFEMRKCRGRALEAAPDHRT